MFLTMWEVGEAAETAATAAELASAAEAATTAAEIGAGLETLGTIGAVGEGVGALEGLSGLGTVSELGGVGSGITQAELAGDVLAGGAGAGGAGINEAIVGAQQNAAMSIPNSGIPMADQYAQATTSTVSDAGNGFRALDPNASKFTPQQITEQQDFMKQFAQDVKAAPTTPGYGTVVDPSAPSALAKGWQAATEFAKEHPYITGYVGLRALGAFDQPTMGNFNAKPEPYTGPLSQYHLSPDFQGYTPPQNPYKWHYAEGGILAAGGPVERMSNQNAIGMNTGYPQADMNTSAYATAFQTPNPRSVVTGSQDVAVNPYSGEEKFASGGIASYAKGGNLSSTLDYYTNMMDGHNNVAAAPEKGDPGIFRDSDPDTMYLSAPEAALVRAAKLRKRAYMQGPALKRPTPMGELNLAPPGAKTTEAAHGGIMQAGGHLGGYAAGGNPRLLKGPGDGMSDDIPATIANKQPARLADGEFVVPADVVSHLGNGSTDAGAKKLHKMMTDVRKARTGNPKQGKQINPNRFMPK